MLLRSGEERKREGGRRAEKHSEHKSRMSIHGNEGLGTDGPRDGLGNPLASLLVKI